MGRGFVRKNIGLSAKEQFCWARKKDLNRAAFKSEIAFEKLLVKSNVLWVAGAYSRNWPLIETFYGDVVFKHRRIVLEVDGSSHQNKSGYDAWRDAKLKKAGWDVYRFQYPFDDELKVIKKLRAIFLFGRVRDREEPCRKTILRKKS